MDSDKKQDVGSWEYAGFWVRVGASVIDNIILSLIAFPLLFAFYGDEAFVRPEDSSFVQGPADFIISWIFPAIAIILFWIYKSATPGKMIMQMKIADTITGKPPSQAQCVGRYLAYFASALPLGMGFLWVAFDKKKQGWHDKLAGTVVIKRTDLAEAVKFSADEEQ